MNYLLALISLLFVGCGTESDTTPSFTANSNPYYERSWHLHYSSSFIYPTLVSEDANIHLNETWKVSEGKGIRVAIIDGSFEVTHEDIAANILSTYNAIDSSDDVSNTSAYPSHGQAVSGLIAGIKNDKGSLGVVPQASLVLIKIDLEASDDVDVLRAFDYALSQKVDVINCSWGSYAMSDAVEAKITQVVESGITVVFAAGNDNRSLDDDGIYDESEHPLVIGVGASNELNERASYSNYASALSILSPAGSSSFGVITTDESGSTKGFNQGNYDLNTNYTYFNGTSASAPVVSGSIALLLSINPTLTPLHVKKILEDSADKIGSVEYDEDGFNRYYLHGKINVDRAMMLSKSF